jgi:hypothetical protein
MNAAKRLKKEDDDEKKDEKTDEKKDDKRAMPENLTDANGDGYSD